jgi:hypothetical protein
MVVESVLLVPQYVGSPCHIVLWGRSSKAKPQARRAKSNLSRLSFSEDESRSAYTIHHFRFIRFEKYIMFILKNLDTFI